MPTMYLNRILVAREGCNFSSGEILDINSIEVYGRLVPVLLDGYSNQQVAVADLYVENGDLFADFSFASGFHANTPLFPSIRGRILRRSGDVIHRVRVESITLSAYAGESSEIPRLPIPIGGDIKQIRRLR